MALSIASGDTTQTSTVLWALTQATGTLQVEYSTDNSFTTGVQVDNVNVSDVIIPAKFELDNLTPGTQYFYRFTDGDDITRTGTFRTSIATGTQAGLRFGVSGDWRGELSPYPAIANADERDLEFFMLHGDTIYADVRSPIIDKDQAETLEDYRLKYQEVYSERFGLDAWGDLRASTSVLATIDDHEVTNDFAGGATADTDTRFPETTGLINDTQLFENGLQAFFEYNPIRETFYGETGEDRTANERQIYRFNTYGSDAATMVLDNRSFRDQALTEPTDITDQVQVGTYLAQTFDPTRTMLSRPQLTDLKNDLLQADQDGITWKFVMVPEPIQNLGVLGSADRFEGYAAERTEILKFINDNDIDNVVFVAADIHGTLVNNLTYQDGVGQPQIATNAFEVTTGSVAYSEPFGQTIAQLATDLGLIDAQTKLFYDSLPIAPDLTDSEVPDDKDDFLEAQINAQLNLLGYDPVGLDNNLAIADGLINATLLQGDYAAAHTFGWTEFDIDPVTQKLTVTTYGIEAYAPEDVVDEQTAINAGILDRTPTIVSQFEVIPELDTDDGDGDGNGDDDDGDDDDDGGDDDTPIDDGGGDSDDNDKNGPTDGPDRLVGNDEGDRIRGLGGDDVIIGGLGEDTLIGGDGNDRILGNDADDVLRGNDGEDTLVGGAGSDRIIGGDDDDVLRGQDGNDRLRGDDGNDIVAGNDGNDVLLGGDGNDILRGGRGDDRLKGNDGNDKLNGNGGDDRLIGGTGRDRLNGGAGNDFLKGQGDNDRLIGGNGSDTFAIARRDGKDRIVDLTIGRDQIRLLGRLDSENLEFLSRGNNTLLRAGRVDIAVIVAIEASEVSNRASDIFVG